MGSWWGPAQYAGWWQKGSRHGEAASAHGRGREHLFEPGTVLVVVEAVLALVLAPGGVDAHQLDERADRGSVEQSRLQGGVTAAETPGAEAGLEVEVVGELRPVV